MTIWFDLANSPHVTFFAHLLDELRREHEIIVTCRPLANTCELLIQKGIPYHVIGKHYGKSRLRKALGFPVRCFELWKFLRGHKIDVAVSHSSFYSPAVAPHRPLR